MYPTVHAHLMELRDIYGWKEFKTTVEDDTLTVHVDGNPTNLAPIVQRTCDNLELNIKKVKMVKM